MDRAVNAAATAFETWQHTTPAERSLMLLKLADAIEARADELGRLESKNAGKPVGVAIDEIPVMVDNLRFFAGAARVMEGKAANEYMAGHTSMIRREPVGVVASIAPWNYPLMMAGWKIGPALAAGNTVVLKPSARTPLTALVLAEIAADILPPGVLNVITGTGATIGDPLVGHPKVGMISVTGDTDTGKHIAKVAADRVKRLHLELGGKAPVIVFDDADMEAVIENIKLFGYWNSGQDCTGAVPGHHRTQDLRQVRGRPRRRGQDHQVGRPGRGRRHRDGFAHRRRPGRQGRGHGRARARRRRGRRRRPSAGSAGRLLRTDRHRRSGPAQRDRPGRGLRAGRQRPALQRRGAGHRLGERRSASAWRRRSGRATSGKGMRVAKAIQFGTVWINDHFMLVSEMPHGGFKESGYGKDQSMYAIEDYTVVKHVMLKI